MLLNWKCCCLNGTSNMWDRGQVLYLLVLLCGEFGVGWFISQVWGIELQQECPLHSDHIDCVTSDRYYIFSPMQKKPKSCDSQNHLTTQLFCSWEEVQKSRPVFIHSDATFTSQAYIRAQFINLQWEDIPSAPSEMGSCSRFRSDFRNTIPFLSYLPTHMRHCNGTANPGRRCVCVLIPRWKTRVNECWFNQNHKIMDQRVLI